METYAEISALLKMPKEKLEKESLRVYLQTKLKEYESKANKIRKKYGVSSAKEMEDKYREGILEEENTWEDFFTLDNLEAEIETLKKALEMLND